MAAWRYGISLQVMKLRISARSCNILYLNILTDPKCDSILFFCLLAADPWCVKRRAVGFSEVSLRGVMRSAKPITTAYTLASASTSLGLRIRLQVSRGIKPVLEGTSWVSNHIECWKWLFSKVNVVKPVKIEQSGLSSEQSITGLRPKNGKGWISWRHIII